MLGYYVAFRFKVEVYISIDYYNICLVISLSLLDNKGLSILSCNIAPIKDNSKVGKYLKKNGKKLI